jgi:hypothetical protein
MKKYLILFILLFFILSMIFSNDFVTNLKDHIGKEIRVYVTEGAGQYNFYFFGNLQEVLSDHIKIYNSENQTISFIKISNISSFVISTKTESDDGKSNRKRKR